MGDSAEDSPNYVPALRKGLALLELLAKEGPLSLAQVERASGLNRTMSYRLLRVMGELGYIEHDDEQHTYGLGLRVLELGSAVAERLNFAEIAWPSLVSLREEMQETVTLGVVSGSDVVYLGSFDSQRAPIVAFQPGAHDPLHATAIGKAILAFDCPNASTLKVASLARLTRKTPKTIDDPGALAFELRRTRTRGYALEDEENRLGTRAVAAPVLSASGRPLAALAIAGPIERVDLRQADAIAERLWLASREMTGRMGATAERLAS